MMRPTVSSMLFLAAVLHLPTGQGQISYSRLQPSVKKFVDLAIDNANQLLNAGLNYGHLNFYEIGQIRQVSPHQVIIDVRFKETTCSKASGAKHQHRPGCSFKPRVQVRCFVCQDQYNRQPLYIDCVRRSDEKAFDRTLRVTFLSPSIYFFLSSVPGPPTVSPDLICYSGSGGDYRGAVARTSSGKTCQSWSEQTPHNHVRTPENYPCNGLDNNYCRNPDNERMPWCYTTDSEKRWEYCQIPTCDGVPEPAPEPTIFPEMTCFTCKGVNYRGTVATTISGKTCQRWSDQTPHGHGRRPEDFPLKGLDSNYCRNPDNERMPWCYTTDSKKRWEYCDVSRCDDPDY